MPRSEHHLYKFRNSMAQFDTMRFMKALLLSEYNHLEVTDLPMPRPAADEVLIDGAEEHEA